MFPLSPQSYTIALVKSARFTFYRKSFLKVLLRQTKDKKKRQSIAIVDESSYHGDITYDQWQNITGILKSLFKLPPLPLYNVLSRQHCLTKVFLIVPQHC